MTRRSELKQRYLGTKAQLFGWPASKLFTYRETGVDGLVKRILLLSNRKAPADDKPNGKSYRVK